MVTAKGLRAERAAHPGLPDKKKSRRSSNEVAAEREVKARQVEEAQQRRVQALENAAHEEDNMARRDQALALSKGKPPADLPDRERRTRPKVTGDITGESEKGEQEFRVIKQYEHSL